MSTRSEMCHKTVEECAWELVNEPDPYIRCKHRIMMVGEFGEYLSIHYIETADNIRELMGLKRRYLRASIRKEIKNRSKEHNDACTH